MIEVPNQERILHMTNMKFPFFSTVLFIALVLTSTTATATISKDVIRQQSDFQPGAHCYFYQTLESFPTTPLTAFPRPLFSTTLPSLQLSKFVFPFVNRPYVARCFYYFNPTTSSTRLTLDASSTGRARLLYNNKEILATTKKISKSITNVKKSIIFELQYVYAFTITPPSLLLTFNNEPAAKKISHDRSSVLPSLIAIAPSTASIKGGSRITLFGYGIFSTCTVRVGIKTVKVSIGTDGIPFIILPNANKAGSVPIFVLSSSTNQKSNALTFKYEPSSTCDGIAFQSTRLTLPDGKRGVNVVKSPTCVTLGPDRRLYIGTLPGTVNVLGYDPMSLRTSSFCTSAPIVDEKYRDELGNVADRAILGITFHPNNDRQIYVSTSTSDWWRRSRIARSNKSAWRNGAIDRLQITTSPGNVKWGGICVKYDKRIVTGLPVANGGAHSVNALVFTPTGDLLIAVGASTNMGLPGSLLGGIWESPLSGAVIIARLSRGNKFNGMISYSNPDKPYTAKKISGSDIQVYASGFRNLFAMTKSIAGVVYALDQGPGCPLGGPAVSCADFNKNIADGWNIDGTEDWPSKVKGEEIGCGGFLREEKLLEITNGRYYGHANIQRKECTWIDPLTGKSADGKPHPKNWKSQMSMIKGTATSIAEYTSSHFCNRLRGSLIISTFRGTRTSRVRLASGNKIAGIDILTEGLGGLSFIEDTMGNLIFPRFIGEARIEVLKPIVRTVSFKIFGAYPKWHRRAGGSMLFIGGEGFGTGMKVFVGKAGCTNVKIENGGREAVCKMPARGLAGMDIVDVKIVTGKKQSILTRVLAYMRV